MRWRKDPLFAVTHSHRDATFTRLLVIPMSVGFLQSNSESEDADSH